MRSKMLQLDPVVLPEFEGKGDIEHRLARVEFLARQTNDLLRQVLSLIFREDHHMSQLDDKITALKSDVDAGTTVVASAVTLLNGIQGQVAAAVAAALAAGATPDQLTQMSALDASLQAENASLAAAVAANTVAAPVPAPVAVVAADPATPAAS